MMYLAADGFSGLLVSSGFCVNRTLILEVILQKHHLNFILLVGKQDGVM